MKGESESSDAKRKTSILSNTKVFAKQNSLKSILKNRSENQPGEVSSDPNCSVTSSNKSVNSVAAKPRPHNSLPGSFFSRKNSKESELKLKFKKLTRSNTIISESAVVDNGKSSEAIRNKNVSKTTHNGGKSLKMKGTSFSESISDTWHGSREVLKAALANAMKANENDDDKTAVERPILERLQHPSVNGANLDMEWSQLSKVQYYAAGGNTWLYSAVLNGKRVLVKTIKPRCNNEALAMKELESELEIHAHLSHINIVELVGAGLTTQGQRFIALERLDGGSLSKLLITDDEEKPTSEKDEDRKKKEKSLFTLREQLKHARSLADALLYCHSQAIPESMIVHRDLKPDNIVFTSDGLLKLIDFGLAIKVENASHSSDDVYEMSGKTGSYRYMSPEVARELPYNHKADVYSFGLMLWVLFTKEKPYEGMDYNALLSKVWTGAMERPPLNHHEWPAELCKLMQDCWR